MRNFQRLKQIKDPDVYQNQNIYTVSNQEVAR